jgi:hypothetical protein
VDNRQNYLFPVPGWTEIAKAARSSIRAVKADHPDVENIHLAALIDADSAKTIERLERMETKKVPASLFTAIGAAFGAQYVQPYMELFGCKAVPLHCQEAVNALPALTALTAKMAAALTEGRAELDHIALGGMLHELREVDGVVSKLRSRALELGMSA